jgi:sugar lactone lactonase YvrE
MTAHRPRVVIMLVAAVCLFAQSTAPAHAAAVTSPSACSPVSGTKPLIRGLVDRGAVPPATDLQASSVNVDWSALEPSGPGLVANNPIDQAIAAAGCTPLRIRVLAGIATPAWVLADTGSVSVTNPYSDTPGTAGLFWTSEYAYWYDNLESELAAKYDSVPNVDEFVVSRCALFYPEPFILGTSIASNDTALLAAGYTESADQQCLVEEIDTAAQDWHTTRIGVSFNPYQTLVAASNSNGYTTGVDEGYTEQVMAYCRNELGPRCVLENDSIRDPISSLTSQYTQMYSAMTGASGPIDLTLNNLNVNVTLGAPIAFQTATATNIGDFWGTLEWARENHASSVELPLDGTYPVDGGAGAPAWQTLGEVAQWFQEVPTITPTPVNAVQGTSTAGDAVSTLTLDELAADDTVAGYGDVGSVPFDTVTAAITWPDDVTRPALVSLGQGSPLSTVTCATKPSCSVTVYSDGYTFPGVTAGTATVAVTLATGGIAYTPADGVDIVANVPVTVMSSGAYIALTPFRICDTRPPGGGVPSTQCNTGPAPIGPLGAGTPRAIQVTGLGGVPAEPGVSAVVVNLTAIAPSVSTVLTLYPDGAKSNTSNLNPAAGKVVANLVEVAVSSGGKIDVLNGLGTVNIALDIEGYVSTTASGTAGLYNPTAPTRICDTRSAGTGISVNQCNAHGPKPITPSAPLTFNVSDSGSPVPSTGVSAVVFNLTAIAPTANTVLTAYPGGSPRPIASNINLVAGAVVPNRVIVPVPHDCNATCTVTIYNGAGSVNVAVDIDGWFTDNQGLQTHGALFNAVVPSRICDTRVGNSADIGCAKRATPSRGVLNIQVAGVGGIPALGGSTPPVAAVINVTALQASAPTYVTVYSSDISSVPEASDLNVPVGLATTNLVVVAIGSNGTINLFNAAGNVNLIVDVLGYYSEPAGSVPTYQSDIFNAGGVAPMYPAGGQTDSSGNMYIADSGGSRVDMITPGGTLTYIVPSTGTPLSNPRNLSIDVTDPADLWVTDTGNNGLVEITTSGTVLQNFNATSTPALDLTSPFGNDNDSTGVYVADTYAGRIIKVSKTDGSTLWSQTNCNGAMSRPRDVAVGSDGNIYAVDTDNNRVVELDPTTGACIASWAGSGQALHQPRAITSDGAGGLWIAEDGQNPAITHYTDAGAFIGSTLNTGAGGDGFIEPEGVFLDGSNVVAADPFANQVVSFTVSSGIPAAAGTAINKGGPALGGFNNPFGVAYAPNGDCFVTDMFNQRIEKFTGCAGTPIATGNFGGGNGAMQNPRGISVSPDGSTVILTNSEDERIDFFSASTLTYESSINPVISTCGNKNLYFPHQVAYDATNNSYWVADTNNNRIVDLSAASATLGDCLANWTGTGATVSAPRGIVWDGTSLWVANAETGQILKCTTAGACTVVAARTGTPTIVNSPWNMSIANGDLYIADEGAGSVVVMHMTAPYSTVYSFGTPGTNPSLGQLGSPRSVAVNPVNGEIAVADFENNDISFWK